MNTPPKYRHAASHPAITSASVCVKHNQTNRCCEYPAVKINACTARRRPETGSSIIPSRPQSSWHSIAGVPSATRTVAVHCPKSHRSTANRCNVRYGTTTPRRANLP